jgi:hypothetical protein
MIETTVKNQQSNCEIRPNIIYELPRTNLEGALSPSINAFGNCKQLPSKGFFPEIVAIRKPLWKLCKIQAGE